MIKPCPVMTQRQPSWCVCEEGGLDAVCVCVCGWVGVGLVCCG